MNVKFPIGQLELPETITLDHIHEWMKDIETYTNRLRATVDGLNDSDLKKTYRDGSYSVRQLVHHIADSQLIMYQRLKMALKEDNPTVSTFDQNKWVVLPDSKLPIESSIKMLEGINERIVALGTSLKEEELTRVFTRADEGKISVATKLAKLSWHEEHHLEHIKIALSN
ncbi:YfiT family bacillithiol transferase [Alkalibacillus salilacus]|uniref:Damage-inducible protein DinB n=1 Tax=Alkalibacillus salilacus TaxID=284582 RepID=A0ABT9VGE4_9BACI|nr:putative metal-dependent hydrolase [Alkalibacillus salilacus]MDQ0160023.1 putative damage-inducible protein DinB [Alkalibacillus salilacus]